MIAPLAMLAGIVGAAAASAQEPTIEVSPVSVPAGGSVTISGVVPTTGDLSCPESDVATLTSDAALFPPDGFGPDLARDASGAFQLAYVVDASTAAGTYEIGVRCGGGNVGISASLDVTVVVPPTTPPNSTTNAVVTTAPTSNIVTSAPPQTVIATAVVQSPETTVATSGDGGGGRNWWLIGLVAAAVVAVLLIAWRGRSSAK